MAKTSAAGAEQRRLRRAFKPADWSAASKLARQYRLVIEPEPALGYVGHPLEMPGVMADGKTIERCAANVLEAATLVIATLLEAGERAPSPARERKRDQQVNIRLSAEEKVHLEAIARAEGFANMSDYVRSAALRSAG